MYDQGVDVKSRRGGGESGSEDDEEEHRQSLREEIERKCPESGTAAPPAGASFYGGTSFD